MVCRHRGIKDETISIYDFAVLGILGGTLPYAEAGNLTGCAYLITKVQVELF